MRYYEREQFDAYARIKAEGLHQWSDLHDELASFEDFPNRPFLERTLPAVAPGQRSQVLEYGCGTGPAACFLAERGYDVHGIDLVPDAIENAQQHASERELTVQHSFAGDGSGLGSGGRGRLQSVRRTLHGTPSARVHQVVGGEGAERRAQLVRAAFDRVAEGGFEGLRLRQVAEDVGIDHSTLHHYFATKQNLIGAVADYATRQFWVLGDSVPEDPADALRAHLAGLRQLINDWPELLVVTAELDLRARRDPVIAVALDRQQAGWREVLVSMLNRGNAGGAWAVDAAACAELVIAVVKGVRLAPDLAGPAFAQLEQLLRRDTS